MKRLRFLPTLVALTMGVCSFGQSYQVYNSNTKNFTINGDSDIKKWVLYPEDVQATSHINNGQIESLKLKFKVSSFSAGDIMGASTMEEHTANCLEPSRFPSIEFVMSSFNLNGNRASIHGDLTIHGVKKSIVVTANYQKLSNGNIQLSGSHALKFSDFNLKAPVIETWVFDAEVADPLVLKFNFTLNR